MLKVTPIETGSRLTLRIEGALTGPWVSELRAVCERSPLAAGRITLDLRGLTFIDREGAGLLLALERAERAELSQPSAFVREILRGVAS